MHLVQLYVIPYSLVTISTKAIGVRALVTLLREIRAFGRRRQIAKSHLADALNAVLRTEALFIHIPKCGGKSVIKELYGLEMHQHFGHASASRYMSIFGPRRYSQLYSFAFARDPLARAISGYTFYRAGGFGGQNSKHPAYTETDSFDQFVQEGHLAARSKIDIVFQPQASFVTDQSGQLCVDDVFSFTQLEEQLKKIMAKSGIEHSQPIQKLNPSQRQKPVTPDPEIVAAVKDVYAIDYGLLGDRLAWS